MKTLEDCDPPDGYADNTDDCDDARADVNGRRRGLRLHRQRCDTDIDEDDAVDAPTWYGDGDSDGYGLETDTRVQCEQPEGYLDRAGDCDDGNGDINPTRPRSATRSTTTAMETSTTTMPPRRLDRHGLLGGWRQRWVRCRGCPPGLRPSCEQRRERRRLRRRRGCHQPRRRRGLRRDRQRLRRGHRRRRRQPRCLHRRVHTDSDSDGYGDATSPVQACEQPSGTVVDATDCEDGTATSTPPPPRSVMRSTTTVTATSTTTTAPSTHRPRPPGTPTPTATERATPT